MRRRARARRASPFDVEFFPLLRKWKGDCRLFFPFPFHFSNAALFSRNRGLLYFLSLAGSSSCRLLVSEHLVVQERAKPEREKSPGAFCLYQRPQIDYQSHQNFFETMTIYGAAAAAATDGAPPATDDAALLTDAEAALYDRQLRVWGVEAQKR